MVALLHHTFRILRRSPAFTLAVIAILGIRLGLNIAIFSVVDCVLAITMLIASSVYSHHFIDENRSIPQRDPARTARDLEFPRAPPPMSIL